MIRQKMAKEPMARFYGVCRLTNMFSLGLLIVTEIAYALVFLE